jgi:hypothetical protein
MFAQVLNRRQACWSILLFRFNFMITYRPRSQQGRSDALSRRSYLAAKEGNAAYDQQHSGLYKRERLLLRTVYTTTSMDPIFLTNSRVSVLLDTLALKFKQSCPNFRPQNGTNRSSKFSNSGLGDPRSGIPGFPKFQLTNP